MSGIRGSLFLALGLSAFSVACLDPSPDPWPNREDSPEATAADGSPTADAVFPGEEANGGAAGGGMMASGGGGGSPTGAAPEPAADGLPQAGEPPIAPEAADFPGKGDRNVDAGVAGDAGLGRGFDAEAGAL